MGREKMTNTKVNSVPVSAAQRPHAILCIDSDVETVSSLLDAATHHMQDMRIHI
jgi:hypothetical protein